MVLDPWTGISPAAVISRFASPATITVLAMLMLSTGASRTGLVQRVGQRMTDFAGDDLFRQLLADSLGALAAASAEYLPLLAVLRVSIWGTGLLTGAVGNNASVVLMLPVAAEAAVQVGANPFAFVLAVAFAVSTAVLTPVGYQTTLFVYGPVRFTDYFRVGVPRQMLLSGVAILGIVALWGLQP